MSSHCSWIACFFRPTNNCSQQRWRIESWRISSLPSSPINLMLPSIFRFAMNFASSSSTVRIPDRLSKAPETAARFLNSSRHLLSSRCLKVVILASGGSRFGACSASRLHSCAYIELYFGSSRAFSNISNQLFKLLRRDLVEDPSDPSEHQIIVLMVFLVGLGGLFPSNSFGWGNPSSSCSGAGQLRCSTGLTRESPGAGYSSRRGGAFLSCR